MTATVVLVCLLQTTWVVDANGGAGTTHSDLPPAIATASNGDTILVRSGSYSGFAVSGKALKIRGAGRGSTFVAGASIGPLVSGELTLSGLTVQHPQNLAILAQGAGTVILLDCDVRGGAEENAMDVRSGHTVHVARSRFAGGDTAGGTASWNFAGHGVEVVDSTFSGHECEFDGGAASGFGYVVGGHGVAGSNTMIELRDCSCVGGGASPGFSFPIGGHGISTSTSSVRLAGSSMIARGGGAIGAAATSWQQGVAVDDYLGQAFVHAGVSLQPAVAGASVTAGNVTQGLLQLPSLSVTGVVHPSGETNAAQPVTIAYDGLLPNALAFLAVGMTPAFTTTLQSQLGTTLVQLSTAAHVLIVLDNQGQFSLTLPPAAAFPLLGIPIHAQAATLDVFANRVRISNAQVRVLSL